MLINSDITGKVIKKIVKIAVLVLVILITAVATLFTILRSPSFQELAGRLAAGYLSEKFNINIRLEKLRINDLLYLEINGLYLVDHHQEEMIRVDNLVVRTDYVSLARHELYFDRVSIDGGKFALNWYPGDTMTNLDYFLDGFSSDAADTDTTPAPVWRIRCDNFSANGLAFAYQSEDPDTLFKGINFEDLSLSEVFIDIKDITITGDSISAYVDHISMQEKSGFELLNFSGDANVSGSGIVVEDAQISTGNTSLDLDISFLYDGWDRLSWFLDSVNIVSDIRSSLVTPSDIGYFAPELRNMEDPVMLSCQVNGPVSDFRIDSLKLSLGEFTGFNGSLLMKGLPNFYSTYAELEISSLTTTPGDVRTILQSLTGNTDILPAELNQLGFTSVKGWYRGTPGDFSADLAINSDAGILSVTGEMMSGKGDSALVISGAVSGVALDIGAITGSEELGTVDIMTGFSGAGKSFEDLALDMEGEVSNLVFRDYRYEKIAFDGILHGASFDGNVVVTDPSLDVNVSGKADFNGDYPVLDVEVLLNRSLFNELHLADRSEDMNLSTRLTADVKGIDPDSFTGTITIDGLTYTEHGTDYHLEHLELNRVEEYDGYDILTLRSDFVDGDVKGSFSVINLVDHLIVFLLDQQPDPDKKAALDNTPQDVLFDFHFKDLTEVTEIFISQLQVAPGSKLSGSFNSDLPVLELEGNVDAISYAGVFVEDLVFYGTTDRNDFNLDLTLSKIRYGDEEEGDDEIGIENATADIFAGNDSVVFAIKWDNRLPDQPNNGSVEGFLHFFTLDHFEAGLTAASAEFAGSRWNIDQDNLITIDSTHTGIHNLKVMKGEESFVVDGAISDQQDDTLSLYFNRWSLENFNALLENISLDLTGIINGRFGIYRNQDKNNLFAGLTITDFGLNDVYFGEAEIRTKWLQSEEALSADVNLFSKGSKSDRYKILGVNGYYYPFNEKRNFDFDITAQNLNISVLEPLLSSFSSHIDGFATGKLTLDGTLKEPVLLGRLKLQRAEMQVDYLNVIYSFSNEVVFTKDQIQFTDLTVYDPNSNTAKLSGGIKHKAFNDMTLDLTINPENFMAMNLNRYQNEVFYGKAFATGTVRLYGPFENLTIDVDVKTEKGTNVFLPINYSVDVSENNFIVFVNTEDTATSEVSQNPPVVGVSLDISMNVNRNADIEIFLPGNIGNIKASGEGDLRLGVDPNGYLTLMGSYKIYTGLFVFSLEDIVSRRFDILEGSSISWTGDINDADVKIVARYRIRTSLEGLGISIMDPEAASQKVIVNTDIRMTGNLFNPDLSFGISFPNMQEQTKQSVYAVLDTNDAGLMNQQAISLLVLGSFSSTGTSSVSNPVNPAAIVSNTLSNMLSQISNDFNIGINYMPGDQVSDEQLEVALSTQLLDDRLVIDGNFDVSGNTNSSQKTSSIVGDINIEYKLTPDGRFRVKAFNRSNDLTMFNDYAPYTQGVGVFYRKDFNKIGEVFRKSGTEKKQNKDPKR